MPLKKKFNEYEKNIIKEHLVDAYTIGNANGLFTVYYAYIDSFGFFTESKSYFENRFDMENFVSNLENRFKEHHQIYYIHYDGDKRYSE